jgi:hypothetical protein
MVGVFLGRIHYPDGWPDEIAPFPKQPEKGETTRLRDSDWLIVDFHHTTSLQDADERIAWDIWVRLGESV